MTTITIDVRSPERAWPPFMEWMLSQDLDPEDTRAITIDPTDMAAVVTLIKRVHGQSYLENGDVATNEIQVPISSLPPRRADTPD